MQEEVRGTSAKLRGADLEVRQAGDEGPTVMFLHGADGHTWPPFLDELKRRFRVVAPQHPGFGTSVMPEWLDNIYDVALFYLEFLKVQKLERVHLIGHDMGGWIAAEIAMFDSSRLASLTLVAAPGLHIKGAAKADVFLMSPEEVARASYHTRELGEAEAARVVSPTGADERLRNRFMAARLGWQPRFYDPLLMKWLSRVDLPAKIIWGRDDQILSTEHAKAFGALLPQASVEIIPDCGHLPHIERPGEFVKTVVNFITGVEK
jgi:pimeloyl-ACP methyl ester carboxylesterase